MFLGDGDGLFDAYPDMDFDGDRDLEDALILEDILDEEERITNDSNRFALSISELDEDDILLEYGIDPDDYATREDYLEAVRDAMCGNCETAEDTSDFNLTLSIEVETDNDDEYRAYLDEKRQIQEFITNGNCIASKYLTEDGVFLYVKAIKDHFKLPFDISDNANFRKMIFENTLVDLAECDEEYALEIWEWCLDVFMPYIQYADYDNDLTTGILIDMGNFPKTFPEHIVVHMVKNPSFIEKLILNCTDTLWCIEEFVCYALKNGHVEIAKKIMECAFANQHTDIHDKINFINSSIDECSDWETKKTMELFQKYVFPIVFSENDVRIKNKIPCWEKDMRLYIEQMEQESDQYTYSENDEWRSKYRNEELDPTCYESEEEYLSAVKDQKYGWRKYCNNQYGIDPADYETRSEYDTAIKTERAKERELQQKASEPDSADMNLYRFCQVKVDQYSNGRYYHYLTNGLDLHVGDCVTVPFGRDNIMTKAQVVSVGECYGFAFPIHVNQIKTVANKLERDE